jgi:peptide/nickel transport system permease protein
MLRYLARRLLQLIPVLFGVTIIIFVITHAVPSNSAALFLGRGADDPVVLHAFMQKWGLNESLPVQYFIYMRNLVHGDLGTSIFTHDTVSSDLLQYFPATVELALFAMLITIVVAIPLGVLAAVKQGTAVDLVIRMVTLVGSSLPVFWLALLMLEIFYLRLGMAPGPGRLSSTVLLPSGTGYFYVIGSFFRGDWPVFLDALSHLIMPALVLASWSIGVVTRVTRASVLNVLRQDYMRTARAKGAGEVYVILHHGVPNALLPILTLSGLAFADMMSGAVATETIFSWPGIGLYSYQAATSLDFAAIMGVALLVSFVYLLTNLTVDMLYGVIDRRARVYKT